MNTKQTVEETYLSLHSLVTQLEEAKKARNDDRITMLLGQIHLIAEQGLISWHIQKNKKD